MAEDKLKLGPHELGSRLFVGTGTEMGAALFASSDWGETWTRYSAEGEGGFWDGRYFELAPIGDRLLVTTSRGGGFLYVFENDRLRRVIAPFFPGLERGWPLPHRVKPFRGGVLYTAHPEFGELADTPRPLYFTSDPDSGALLVEAFRDRTVQDMVVRGERCYVLTSARSGDAFEGELYMSTDPENWTRVASFNTPAQAHSLEELAGVFYVGLACGYEEANPMSGRICRLE